MTGFFPFNFDALDPLLILGVVLVAGAAGGWVAQRLHVPTITGNIVAGAALGMTLFHDVAAAQVMQPLSTFALSLIAVSAGGHFSLRRIHNALGRISAIAVGEIVFAAVLVYAVMRALGAPWTVALIACILAVETAPGTTIAIIRETRAKGPLVKTLAAVVSIDASICILLFAFARNLLADYFRTDEAGFTWLSGLTRTSWLVLGSVSLGLLLGVIAERLFRHPRFHDFSTMLVAILFAAGLSNLLRFSPLLTCLVLGVYLGNRTRETERQLTVLDPVEPLLYTAFFTLAGVALHLSLLLEAGLLALGYFLARALGKGVGAYAGAVLTGCSPRIRNNIPFAFMPHASVALGLIVLLEGDARIPSDFSALVGTIVIAAVTLNEMVGPFFTRAALRRAGEAELDRPRLVDFLQEEYILPNLQAQDRWDAIQKLVDFYGRTHKVRGDRLKHVLETVLEREHDASTAIGKGAALPHGRTDSGHAIEGVMAICPNGVDFGAPDGEPVKLIMLVVTPKEHETRHLEVLASLSAMVSNPQIRNRLINAADANDAWEVIESEESRPYNYFLEESEGPAPEEGFNANATTADKSGTRA